MLLHAGDATCWAVAPELGVSSVRADQGRDRVKRAGCVGHVQGTGLLSSSGGHVAIVKLGYLLTSAFATDRLLRGQR